MTHTEKPEEWEEEFDILWENNNISITEVDRTIFNRFLARQKEESYTRGKRDALSNGGLTRSEAVRLREESYAQGRKDEREEVRKLVMDNTPKHITREYRDTDKMRDNLLTALCEKNSDKKCACGFACGHTGKHAPIK